MNTLIRGAALLVALAAALAGADAASAQTAGQRAGQRAGHVIVIGVDGLSPDGVLKADAPTLRHMMDTGAWSLNARGVFPTTSSANWASMLTGVGPEQHGVTSNDWRVGQFNVPASVTGSGNFYPSIFQVIADQRPDWTVGSIYHWQGFGDLYDHRFVDHDAHGATEDETATLAADYIRAEKPQFLFVHLDHVDHAGHAHGHGTPLYYESVTKTDRLVARIRQATVDAGIADDTVIIVTSDHGGVGKGHGGETLAELEIPWIVHGKGVNPGVRLDLPINIFDTPATAAWLLGLDIPYAWLGRPVTPVLAGEPMPAQAYRTSSFYAAPVIEPEGEGNAPSGGLFIDRPARMTIRNPNTVGSDALGEVRYTLDGSIPTLSSPLYAAPVDITRYTIARAVLFVDGQAASPPATGYFRVVNLADGAPRGVSYKTYLLPEGSARLPDFSRLEPVSSGESYEFSIDDLTLPRENLVAVVFEGFIHIDVDGDYTFALASDDGSKLYIDGKTVVDNDGDHGVITASGAVRLGPGKHPIRVEWFNGGGGYWLGAYIEGPGLPRQFIDPNRLTPR